jgi:hypothetical protein
MRSKNQVVRSAVPSALSAVAAPYRALRRPAGLSLSGEALYSCGLSSASEFEPFAVGQLAACWRQSLPGHGSEMARQTEN